MESFCEKLKTLLTHSFIAKQQSAFHMEVKSSLQSGVFQVVANFAENYSFVTRPENLSTQNTPFHIMVHISFSMCAI